MYATVQYGNIRARVVRDGTKLYTSHRRARVYGCCREPSPCGGKWVAFPFWTKEGATIYLTEDEYAEFMKA